MVQKMDTGKERARPHLPRHPVKVTWPDKRSQNTRLTILFLFSFSVSIFKLSGSRFDSDCGNRSGLRRLYLASHDCPLWRFDKCFCHKRNRSLSHLWFPTTVLHRWIVSQHNSSIQLFFCTKSSGKTAPMPFCVQFQKVVHGLLREAF